MRGWQIEHRPPTLGRLGRPFKQLFTIIVLEVVYLLALRQRIARAAGLVCESDIIYFRGWHLTIPLAPLRPAATMGLGSRKARHSRMQATCSHCQGRVKTPLTPPAAAAVVRVRGAYWCRSGGIACVGTRLPRS
jgi:hypothetical protein